MLSTPTGTFSSRLICGVTTSTLGSGSADRGSSLTTAARNASRSRASFWAIRGIGSLGSIGVRQGEVTLDSLKSADSFEPVENSLAVLADYIGPHKIMWATDYPHQDGFFPGAPKMIAIGWDVCPPRRSIKFLAGGSLGYYGMN